jgi:hypothetical protein
MFGFFFLFSFSSSDNITIDRLRHFECFNVVRQIDHGLREQKSTETLNSELTAHCSKLRDDRQAICLSLIPSKIPNITAQILNKTLPVVICESLGYVQPFSGGRLITPAQCEKFVDLVRSEIPVSAKNKSEHLPKPFQKKEGKLLHVPTACRALDTNLRLSCHVIGRLVSRGLQGGLGKEDTSAEICNKLHGKHLIKLVDSLPGTKTAG